MIRKITHIVSIICICILACEPQAHAEYNMKPVNQLIEVLVANEIHIVETSLDEDARANSAEYIQLKNKCKTDWRQIIDNLELVEKGDKGKALVITALQTLNAVDYMSAFDKLVARYEANTLSKALMDELLNPTGKMKAFLIDNYKHARVITALNKIKAKSTAFPDLVTEINSILGGTPKTELDKYRDAHQDTSEGNIPIILLPQ